MLRLIGLLTVIYLVLLAAGVSPHALVKKSIREVEHATMTPGERRVAAIKEPVEDAVDAAKQKVHDATK